MSEKKFLAEVDKEANNMMDNLYRSIKEAKGDAGDAQLVAAYFVFEIAKIKVALGLNEQEK